MIKDSRQEDDRSNSDGNNPSLPYDLDVKVRCVLAYSTVLLLFFSLVIYLVTRDIATLGESTIIGAIALLVFTYYFARQRK